MTEPKFVVCIMGKAGAGKDTVADITLDILGYGKKYSFADPLKKMCSEVFDIPIEWMYDQDLKKREVVINLTNPHTISRMEEWVYHEIAQNPKWRWVIAKPELSGFGDGMRYQQVAKTLLGKFQLILNKQFLSTNSQNVYKLSIRKMLQLMGTEVIRSHVSDDFWAEMKKSVDLSGSEFVIIPDCRFKTELEYAMSFDKHVVVVVENDDLTHSSTHTHSSEEFVDHIAECFEGIDTKPLYIKNNLQGDYDKLREMVESSIISEINFKNRETV